MIIKYQPPQTMKYTTPPLQDQTSLQHLPNEIVAKITQSLSRKDAYQCMFVCRSWYQIALPVFYKDIFFSRTKFNLIGPDIISGKHAGKLRHSHLIKSVGIEDDINDVLPQKFLRALFSYTTRLETIDLSYCNDIESFLSALKRKSTRSMVPHLGKIKFHFDYNFDALVNYAPRYEQLNKAYLDSCYNFRKSLKYLEIHDIKSLKYVNYFPQLTHLTISANLIAHLLYLSPMNEIEVMEYVLKQCTNLKSFQLLHYYNMTEFAKTLTDERADQVRQRLERGTRIDLMQEVHNNRRQDNVLEVTQQIGRLIPYISRAEEAMNTDYTVSTNEKPLYTQLKDLTYVSSTLSKEQIDFISNNISLNSLQNLSLAVNRFSAVEWFSSIGFDQVFKFAHRLNQVQNLQLKFAYTGKVKDYGVNPFGNPDCSPIQELWTRTLLWTFIEKIRGARNFKYSINLDVSPKRLIFSPKTVFKLKGAEKTIYLDQAITLNSFLYSDYVQHDEPDSQNRLPKEVLPPHDLFLPQVAQRTKHLTINLPTTNCIKEITLALETFTCLQKLVIHAAGRLGDENYLTGSSIECQSDNLNNSSPKLTQATLTKMHLTPKFNAAFIYKLPHLTSLNLVNCDYFDAAGWISKQPYLDLTRLRHLKHLSLTVQLKTASYDKVLVSVHHYLENKSQPHCKRKYILMSDCCEQPTMRSVAEDYVGHTIMTLTIRAGDALTMITFGKSDHHPLDAILD